MGNRVGKRSFGQVKKRASGRWQAFYAIDGVTFRAEKTFDSKGEATRWLSSKETEIAKKTWIDPRLAQITVRDYAENDWIPGKSWAPRTADTNLGNLKNHVYPTFGGVPLGDLRTADIRKWFKELKDRTPSAAAKSYGLLKQICASAVDDRYLAKDPCILKDGTSESPKVGQAASVDQVQKLAESIVPRLRAAVYIAAYGEARYGELIALQRRHFDPVAGVILIEQAIKQRDSGELYEGPTKNRRTRTVTLPTTVSEELIRHLAIYVPDESPNAFLFRGPTGATPRRQNWSKLWRSALKRAGLKESGIRWHDLRHTGNTLAAQTGATRADLQARGGWNSASMVDRYMHTSTVRDQLIAENLETQLRAAAERAANDEDVAEAQIIQLPGTG